MLGYWLRSSRWWPVAATIIRSKICGSNRSIRRRKPKSTRTVWCGTIRHHRKGSPSSPTRAASWCYARSDSEICKN
uniref:Putative secreted peptide n=1 Tax=Anopheles braziliensis TaxID=58242 RepID=A0A2M3ZTP5_9DIPT